MGRASTVHGTLGTGLLSRSRRLASAHQCLVSLELSTKLVFCQWPVFRLRALGLRLGNRARVKTKLNLLTTLVVRNIRSRNTLHTEDLDFIAVTAGDGVLDAREAGRGDVS